MALRGTRQTSLKQGFALGFVAGLFYWGALLYWIFALYEWVGLLILPAYLLLIGYLSLYWGIFGAFYTLLRQRFGTIAVLIAAPALWIVLEFIKAQGPLGFTWGDLAYVLYRRPELIQLTSVTGVWGISFVIVFINSLLALGVQRALEVLRRRSTLPYIGTAVVILVIFWGANALLTVGDGSARPDIQVAVVQSEVSQRQKRDLTSVEEVMTQYEQLLSGIDRPVDLVVLPESITLVAFPLQQRELLEPFTTFARDRRTYVLLGLVNYRDGRCYNSAALISPAGEVVGVYDKVHLVPFGEYIPLQGVLERLGLLGWITRAIPGGFTPGKSFSPIESALGRVASPIRFESIFPQISRTFTENGAQLLVAVTNEAWYKGGFALPQHFAMGVFRAVGNRRFFIQSSNAGLSGIISPGGQILVRSGPQKATVVYGTVSLRDEMTFYDRFGDWPVYLAALYLAACMVVRLWVPPQRR
jgi:apolipoprotein N-acyltransferase